MPLYQRKNPYKCIYKVFKPMMTIAQIRAARALLDWSQSDLADYAGLSQTGIARIENGTNKPNSSTLDKINTAFDRADIEFIGETGVKKRTGEIQTLHGAEGLKAFLDDLYVYAQKKGGEFCLHNADPDNWYKWVGREWFDMHSERMAGLSDTIAFKITCAEGMGNLISSGFAEYRWFPKDKFSDQSIYAYGETLAFVHFGEESLKIDILKNEQFSKAFQVLFDIAWETTAQKVK